MGEPSSRQLFNMILFVLSEKVYIFTGGSSTESICFHVYSRFYCAPFSSLSVFVKNELPPFLPKSTGTVKRSSLLMMFRMK